MHELLTGHSTSEQTNRKRVFALFCLKIMIIGVYGTVNIGKIQKYLIRFTSYIKTFQMLLM